MRSFEFTDVRVPVVDVIGGEGAGWEVAQTLLDVERGGQGITLNERKAIEERERAHWVKLPPSSPASAQTAYHLGVPLARAGIPRFELARMLMPVT